MDETITWGIPGNRQRGYEEDEESTRPAPLYLQTAAHRAYDAYLRIYPLPQDGDYSLRGLLARAASGKGLLRTQIPMLLAACREWAGRCGLCRGEGVFERLGDSRLELHDCDSCAGTGVRP